MSVNLPNLQNPEIFLCTVKIIFICEATFIVQNAAHCASQGLRERQTKKKKDISYKNQFMMVKNFKNNLKMINMGMFVQFSCV